MSRNGAWSDAEVTALISIWGDAEIQKQLDGATRNKSIFLNISRKLKDNGYERDWQQCRAKIKNLKGDYKKVKDHNGVTGNGRKTFKFYDKLDEILGHRPSSVPHPSCLMLVHQVQPLSSHRQVPLKKERQETEMVTLKQISLH